MPRARVTERSFYDPLKEVIREAGGTAVEEVAYNSVPDIQFDLGQRTWLLSVKIGEDSRTILDAFRQYLRHKEESGIKLGMLLLLPTSVRNVEASEQAIRRAIEERPVTVLIDATFVKEELRDRPFSEVVRFLIKEVVVRLEQKVRSYYSFATVIALLQEQVSEMMREINLSEPAILRIITDRRLMTGLGHLKPKQTSSVGRFLASYILMSQILFLRLLFTEQKHIFPENLRPIDREKLRKAFLRVLDINYRPIFEVEVLDDIPQQFIEDTFDLIWGLEIEHVRHELPGRIFHQLMPTEIRKMLAAFYTRPLAAELLASLTIQHGQDLVFDPACGSGTILVSAYKRKHELSLDEGRTGNLHKLFCEQEIFGADIMPFAVHLTSANLAAIDVSTIIKRTQIIQGDSLRLGPGQLYRSGPQMDMYHGAPTELLAQTTAGDYYKVPLNKVDVILMNPPFTKVERHISDFVDMETFKGQCGGEVGLWGHFIPLANTFLREKGIFGAVIPINVLRGRESEKVRRILFEKWTPLYVIKPTRNYGFSEWSEYRDVLLIATKLKSKPSQKVKFCLVKKDLTTLTETDVSRIANKISSQTTLKSPDLDIESHSLSDIQKRFANMMWFCGVTDFSHRRIIIDFVEKFSSILARFPFGYFAEGFRPVPSGVSEFLFITRHSSNARVREAFLSFSRENGRFLNARSPMGASYKIERTAITRSLRTPVGLSKMDITDDSDYITKQHYTELSRVLRACGFRRRGRFEWGDFWRNAEEELERKNTRLVVVHRMNPYSPSTHLAAFFSRELISPSNQMNVVVESDLNQSKAVCVLLNSLIFLAQFFLLKEESTGRFINIRFYDLNEMNLYPSKNCVPSLVDVFEKYAKLDFPPLRNQFDEHFMERYDEFWEQQTGNSWQQRLWTFLDKPVKPSDVRLSFDLAVSKALGVKISREELLSLYEVLVKEMIITRHLTRD